MKKVLVAMLLIPAVTHAQRDTTFSLPMKNRIVFYEKGYSDTTIPKDKRYDRALKWIAKAFSDSKESFKASDKRSGKIAGTGIFRVVTGDQPTSGGQKPFYWVKCAVTISVSDTGFSFQAFDFYEKPTEPGVTNDYSKLEYRWRDFAKGKPWSAGDQKLFTGIDTTVRSLIASLEKELKK